MRRDGPGARKFAGWVDRPVDPDRTASGLSPGALSSGRLADPPKPREAVDPIAKAIPDDWPTFEQSKPVVRERSGGTCEVCKRRPHVHTHHRKLRRYGDHRPVNLLGLCNWCHDAAHLGDRKRAERMGWIVPQEVDPEGVPVFALDNTQVCL